MALKKRQPEAFGADAALSTELLGAVAGFLPDARQSLLACVSRTAAEGVKTNASVRTQLFLSTTRKSSQAGSSRGSKRKYLPPVPVTDSAITGGWLAGSSLTHVDFSGARLLTDASLLALSCCPLKILNLGGTKMTGLHVETLRPMLVRHTHIPLRPTSTRQSERRQHLPPTHRVRPRPRSISKTWTFPAAEAFLRMS